MENNDGNSLLKYLATNNMTPDPQGIVGGLGRLFIRPKVQGLYYNGQTITLDGYAFVGCRFDHCKLSISSANFELISCVIDPSSTIYIDGQAIKAIQLFNIRNDEIHARYPAFTPIRNANGSITISDIKHG